MRTTLFALSLFAAAACRTAPPDAGVRQLLAEQQSAWNRGDVEGFLRRGYWESPELTFFSGGEVVKGFDLMLTRFLAHYKTGTAESGELTFADIEVVALGPEHALARGHWFVDFAKQPDQGGLFTLVLERADAGWRIVHDHTSVASPAPQTVQ